MKFGQLIERNTRNMFLEKSYTYTQKNIIIHTQKAIPRLFSKKSVLSVSLDE